MATYAFVFIAIYLFTMVNYFFSETSGNFKRRAVNKIILASLFWAYAMFETFHFHRGDTLQHLLMLGITFSYIGDIWLLWDFIKGGAVFGIGNAVIVVYLFKYMAALGVPFSAYWWFLLIFAFFIGTYLILIKKGFYKIMKDSMKIAFLPYICSVTCHGTMSLALIFAIGLSTGLTAKLGLMFFGSILFMISDYFIAWHNFRDKESKAILRLNSGTYFTGLMLIALSFSLMA